MAQWMTEQEISMRYGIEGDLRKLGERKTGYIFYFSVLIGF